MFQEELVSLLPVIWCSQTESPAEMQYIMSGKNGEHLCGFGKGKNYNVALFFLNLHIISHCCSA